MSGVPNPVVRKKKPLQHALILGETLKDLTKRIKKEVAESRYWVQMHLVPEEKIVLLMAWDPERKSKWSWVDSVKMKTCDPGDYPPLVYDHPSVADGSAVLVARSYCVPFGVTSYLEVVLGGRSSDPGDSL